MVAETSYATLENLKARLREESDDFNTELQAMLDDATSVIDQEAHRIFRPYLSEIRYFDGGARQHLVIDDLILASLVEIDGEEVDSDLYEFWPYQQQYLDTARLLKDKPFLQLRYISEAATWPAGIRNIAITAAWGWPTVPRQIERACLVFASRFWNQMGDEVFQNERAAQHGFTRFTPDNLQKSDTWLLGEFVRDMP